MIVFDKILKILITKSITGNFAVSKLFDKLICSMSTLALLTIDKWIRKICHMTRSYPNLWIHQNRTVKPINIHVFGNKLLPPCLFNIIFKLNSKWSIIKSVGKTPINLTALKNKSVLLAHTN